MPDPTSTRARLARRVLAWGGYRLVGQMPRRTVTIGAPHTSNWDFVIGILVLWACEVRPRVLVKAELFHFPLGPILRALGAIKTDRGSGSGLVDTLAAAAQADGDFVLALAPDGTRTKVDHWKSGFYRLAQTTGLPVTPVSVDGPSGVIEIGPSIAITGDIRADMDVIRAFYDGKRGVRPGFASTVRLRAEDGE